MRLRITLENCYSSNNISFKIGRYYGGWVAPNIFFLGYSGVVRFGDLRIAGFSGIFKGYDLDKGYSKNWNVLIVVGHFELPPYSEDFKRSAYHVRSYELAKLSLVLKFLFSN